VPPERAGGRLRPILTRHMELHLSLCGYDRQISRDDEVWRRAILAEIKSLPKPKKYDLEVLRDWLGRENGGDDFHSSVEDLPWLESETSDLVAVPGRDFDSITRWTAKTLAPWTCRSKILRKAPVSGQEERDLVEQSDTEHLRYALEMSVVMSSLIPSLAIVILYFIHNLIARILTAMGLSFVFSVALALSTPARPAEIFAASAA
jgi:hypothetical protein